MPGMLYHLFFGKVVLDSMEVVSDFKLSDCKAFMAGNVIPDMCVNKHDAHYYHQLDAWHFYSPDMVLAGMALKNVSDESLRMGIKGHLYLDWRVGNEYLPQHFKLNPLAGQVESLLTGHQWTLREFYSDKGLYRGYGECNGVLLRDKLVETEWIKQNVPRELPLTGIATMDYRRERPWYDELEWMINDPPTYTGKFLVYGEFIDFIQGCAMDFALRDYVAT
ncbi:hypothetical protein IJ096_02300 [Candidatus Saccharibacteria bacterium]|nr:hypothetical protein [Candidatus Saccharibacteria bacterium]